MAKIIQYPDVEFPSAGGVKPNLEDTFKKLRQLLEQAVAAVPIEEPEKGYDKLQTAILKAGNYLKYFDLSLEKSLVTILSQFDKELTVTQNRWNSKDKAKQYRDEFNVLRTS